MEIANNTNPYLSASLAMQLSLGPTGPVNTNPIAISLSLHQLLFHFHRRIILLCKAITSFLLFFFSGLPSHIICLQKREYCPFVCKQVCNTEPIPSTLCLRSHFLP